MFPDTIRSVSRPSRRTVTFVAQGCDSRIRNRAGSPSITVPSTASMKTVGRTVGTAGVPCTSAAGGPSVAPVRVVTRTMYSVPLVRLRIVCLVIEPEVIVACRSPVL